MKIVKTGDTLRIFGDDLETFDAIPAGTYKVEFHPMMGFYLSQLSNFATTEEKIYGSHVERIQKVLNSYKKFNRSMGLILSGNKGMGKSMFVQLIAEEVVQVGLPVIMVTKAYPGIADFIEEIEQECLVIFDEFEKMFAGTQRGIGNNENNNNHIEKQDNLLGLFDGTSQQKRLYAITVNDLGRVNDYMLSRPGRFHYHMRFDYPTPAEIHEYLSDKLEPQYHGEINSVISFANRVKLNYDSLRAIAFELNEGYSFNSAIADLNILNTDDNRYTVKVTFADGKTQDYKNQRLNLFSEDIVVSGHTTNSQYFSLSFNPAAIVEENYKMIVHADDINVHTTDEDGDETDQVRITQLTIKQQYDSNVNYRMTEYTV